jgi:serine/threonine-protein kinase HipA
LSVTSLEVRVAGAPVATLSSRDGFEHYLTYYPGVPAENFVSLLMPVRPQSWPWPVLHPFFQMNLPEGYLLSLLKEQLGPHLGSRPLDLLAVVGPNMIGRVTLHTDDQAPRTSTGEPDFKSLLASPDSLEVFHELMREYASSGVSGVVPKFLSPELKSAFRKASWATDRYIVKGSPPHLPFLALNEHLCMLASARTGAQVARTQASGDGQVLLVERFDITPTGKRLAFEDLCSLLGLTSDDKYNSSWERVAKRVSELVPSEHFLASNEQLARTLLLSFALGNADCHTKNVGLLYSAESDVRVAPIYDMLSIRIYEQYAANSPGMFVGGRKAWEPGKALEIYLRQALGIEPARQRTLTEQVCDALSDTLPEVLSHTRNTPGFAEIGARMIHEWDAGLKRLAKRPGLAAPDLAEKARAAGIPAQRTPRAVRKRTGESELLGRRGRKPMPS